MAEDVQKKGNLLISERGGANESEKLSNNFSDANYHLKDRAVDWILTGFTYIMFHVK